MKVYYDEDANPEVLDQETVAILGYGIQGRAQAHNLRDSGVRVVVGNRDDEYRKQASGEGFRVMSPGEAAERGSLVVMLVPDEVQAEVYGKEVEPALNPGDGLVFAHGFALRYGLIDPPREVDTLLLAPRLPGGPLRQRYLAGWGVPAFVSVERDATGRARQRLLALAFALGITRCGAIEASAAVETELDHFSEHFTYPAIFRLLETAFEALVDEGYEPEVALMELHGSGELGEVLEAAALQGLMPMIDSHASPACQVGISHHWDQVPAGRGSLKQLISRTLENIRQGRFARHLIRQQRSGYPELESWRKTRSSRLREAEENLRKMLRPQP